MCKKWGYDELIEYMGMHKLPKGLKEAYDLYEPGNETSLMPKDEYEQLLLPYDLNNKEKAYLDRALDAIEADERVLYFSNFFVWDMCSLRNKYDIDNYTELVPGCLGEYNNAYVFLTRTTRTR